MATDTIPNRLLERARKTPNDPAYYVRESGSWKPTNWGTYSDQVTQAGRALIALGFEHGQTVCILGFNRPEWAVMDIAAMGAGGAPAGISRPVLRSRFATSSLTPKRRLFSSRTRISGGRF